MADNLEPAAAAARATMKMMQAAGLQSADEKALDAEGVVAALAAQNIALLGLLSFMVDASIRAETEAGTKTPAAERADMLAERLHRIAATFPSGHSARVLKQLDNIVAWLRNNGPRE